MSDNECQSRFITYNRIITPVQDVNSGGSCSGVQAGDKQKLFILSAQFCYESKTAPKIKVYLKDHAWMKILFNQRLLTDTPMALNERI